MKSFNGRVAAITGAASGMGRALALALAREGCHLALADKNSQGLEQTLAAWTEHWMLVMGPVLVLVVLAGKNGLFGRWLGASHGA